MENNYRLKIKIGQHEFEAEGPAEVVQQQFQEFKELVALESSNPSAEPEQPRQQHQFAADATLVAKGHSKIMRVDGRSVSLTVRPDTLVEAILLILYGQKELRQNDSVTGAEIMDGLTSTGGYAVSRIDRYLENLASSGEVIVIGVHRAKRYRLTNTGYARAAQLAALLIALVP